MDNIITLLFIIMILALLFEVVLFILFLLGWRGFIYQLPISKESGFSTSSIIKFIYILRFL